VPYRKTNQQVRFMCSGLLVAYQTSVSSAVQKLGNYTLDFPPSLTQPLNTWVSTSLITSACLVSPLASRVAMSSSRIVLRLGLFFIRTSIRAACALEIAPIRRE